MVIEPTYVQDGDTRTAVSLYQLGVAWKRGFLTGRQVRLTGLALSRRQIPGDPARMLQARWTAARASFSAVR